MTTRNSEVLKSFVAYCEAHPSERFWQALRNWSGYPYIFAAASKDDHMRVPYTEDTFYWEGRVKAERRDYDA